MRTRICPADRWRGMRAALTTPAEREASLTNSYVRSFARSNLAPGETSREARLGDAAGELVQCGGSSRWVVLDGNTRFGRWAAEQMVDFQAIRNLYVYGFVL